MIYLGWPFSHIQLYSVEQDDEWIGMPEASPHDYIITSQDMDWNVGVCIMFHRYWGA